MSLTLRLASCAALVGVVLAGVYLFHPAVLAPLELNLAGASESLRDYFAQQERGQALRQRQRVVLARINAQDAICRELIDGRLILAEAARRFGELPDAPDNFREFVRLQYEGATEEERLARLVIDWACENLREEPERARHLRRRWEAELPAPATGR